MPRRALATAVAFLLALSLGATAPAAAADPPQQWRSYWVDAFNEGVYTPAQVTKLVQDAQAINANALIVQIARRYDCFCNRALYPRTDAAIAPAPYDPLDEVIAQGHAAGLEVHAWVNVNTMWNAAAPHSSPDHVFNKHGLSATGADRWLNKKADGTERVGNNAFMDPANPAANNYTVAAIQSIVREYDVDGINLDYVRYPDFSSTTTHSDWGYSEVSLARFRAATGRTDTPMPSDQQFTDWRREQMTGLVRKIYLGMWEADPQARLSMDGITYGFGPQSVGGWEKTRTYAEVLQDWKGWLSEGIMDTVVAMNYKRNWMPDQKQMYDEWTEVLADWQGDRQAVVGPALYLNSVPDSLAQVRSALAPTAAGNTAAGWSGYSYANPSMAGVGQPAAVRDGERAKLVEALTVGPNAPFADEAVVPTMPWKASPTDGHVAGRVALRDGTALDQVTVSLKPILGHGVTQTRRTDGDGWFGFVHVESGLYFVTVALPDGTVGRSLAVVRVSNGKIADADLTGLIKL
ncbi:family 10 glycosylhydrolase [Catellatospora sichuanensis]|uniref:family 10 glycosylhydrolase n=1 Tax=Catellatospora sichuanensis TaxID=1969805 RepID=UPI0011820D19|nr:family 10 glycosylhydrolase [Catellatospora sichuanensis]